MIRQPVCRLLSVHLAGLAVLLGGFANSALNAGDPGDPAKVFTGIDVLERDQFQVIQGRRVGLITNHTGVNRHGRSIAMLLQQAENVQLVALFSPEHGFAGQLDQARIDDTRDPETGLTVYSLYGEHRIPTTENLRGIDTLVFDIQDIGARFYTYISTMGNAMRAAAEHDVRFVVLDRPNPINGVDVAGPVLDAGRESFVGFHRLPVRHGMTVGELAKMFVAELDLAVDLEVVPVEGWSRSMYYDETGLRWINPSPNMRSLTQALLYPGIGLLETTNLSVGRGTDTPFEVFGAPWIDELQLAGALNNAGLAGVRFVPIRFTPASSKFAGEECGGVNIVVVDRASFEPIRTGLTIAVQLQALFADQWQSDAYGRLLSHQQTLRLLQQGRDVDAIEAAYQPDLMDYMERRARFLLYP